MYKLYNEKLVGIVEVPLIPEGFHSSFAQYTIKLNNKEQRDGLKAKLKEQGIPSMIYYPKPMHKQEAFMDIELNENLFKVTNELCDIVLSLPMHPYMSEDDINWVCDTIIVYIN